ncbi:exodeoxyribonuclease VII large subunit [Blautia obeum]|nr:exodeoxyribonuclease VII large subunit [Blautia obeum]
MEKLPKIRKILRERLKKAQNNKNEKYFSVGQINRYVKNMFTQDFILQKIYVKGEVSNCKYHTSGHIYFSLKDETGVLSCVMFAGHRRGLAFRMKDGDRVVVGGAVDVYERDGRYQLYAKEISLEGAGALYERFLALKTELEEMGMFAQEYKQPIPAFIHRLGVVTAPTGAAVQDIRNISLRRDPYLQIILYPALVQGEGAADSIVRGIHMLDQAEVDVIIVGRGGGSIEDLWAFNEEKVARAIFECRTPIISAVGHETDFTIADFVADLRAPTPSAAAELAVADFRQILQNIAGLRDRMQKAMQRRAELGRAQLMQYQMRFQYLNPEAKLRDNRQRLADLDELLRRAMKNRIAEERHMLGIYLERYRGLSPLYKLNQGYSFVSDREGNGIISTKQVHSGDLLEISVTDGVIEAEVRSSRKEDWNK